MTAKAPSSSRNRDFAILLLVSFLALYYELALIRWIPGCIKTIGYYTNLVLISSFLGLGLGCAQVGAGRQRESIFAAFPFRLALSLAVYTAVQRIGLLPMPAFWGDRIWDLGKTGILPPFLLPEVVFLLNVWCFVALGRELGRAFAVLRPLTGYSLNLAGSLAGVAAITAFGVTSTPPLVWFAVGGAVYLGLQGLGGQRDRRLAVGAGLLALGLVAVYLPSRGTIWSPYYKITSDSMVGLMNKMGFDRESIDALGLKGLSVNDDYFQFQINLDPVVVDRATRGRPTVAAKLRGLAEYVKSPFRLRPPGRVLILGSGLGNDVAAALRNGATRVDAVEIDPVIIRLGQTGHPEKPYSDPRVFVHNTDARRFLRFSRDSFDTIVFAFLDSHTLFSAFSSVRLDNFVYTRESFRDAAARLSPEGLLVVMFAASRDFVGRRLFFMVRGQFPDTTRAFQWPGPWGQEFDVIMGGPALKTVDARAFKDMTAKYFEQEPPTLPTDNWPFLYLAGASLGPGYALTLLVLAVISFFITRRALPGLKSIRLDFFLLGAAFLLLETKSITEVSLLFGSTWVVNVAVISAFLLMALAANLVTSRTRIRGSAPVFAGLGLVLAVAFVLPTQRLFLPSATASGLLAGMVVAAPVFFSGIIFAAWFRDESNPSLAIGSNILGATLGGFLEYASLYTGMKALYVIAAGLYLAAFFLHRRK